MDCVTYCEYVSFDVFDTLIRRSTAMPTDVFRLMEHCCANYDMPKNFTEKRIWAEQNAYLKKKRPVSLEEIYDELQGFLGIWTDKLMKLEIQMELSGCQPTAEGLEIYRYCLNQGKHIILISDMYLSSTIITQMLKKCGVYGYEKLFVSCEMGAKKADGSLYKKVLQELNIRPELLFHIGDNWRSDYAVPCFLGIKVRHIHNNQRRLCQTPKRLSPEAMLSYRTLTACLENSSAGMSEYEKQGAEIFGPLLIGFTKWLAQQLKSDGIKNVYFMSRDGYTMKQAFDLLEPYGFNTHYIYCSRRSFIVPLLWKHSSLKDVAISYALEDINQMTLRIFLSKLGLYPEGYLAQIKKHNLDIDHLYEKGNFFHDEHIKAFYEEIRSDVEKNSRKEYEALLSYIHSCDMKGKIAVVDIGYYGTMQNALEKLVAEAGLDMKVKGYYVGVCPTGSLVRERKISAAGYLYDIGKNETFFQAILPYISIFETLFLEQHGSVRRFVMRDGVGVPEFERYEYEDKAGQKVNEVTIVREYQTGALKLTAYIKKALPDDSLFIEPVVAICRLNRLGIRPKIKEAKMWGDFRFHSDAVRYIAAPRRWKEYVIHPKLLKKDFLPTLWKVGFMKRLFILPLPYEKIIYILQKVYNRKI